jgi:multidrug efflux pump
MNFAKFIIGRPVLCWVMSIIIMSFGLVAYNQLGLRQYPKVSYPIITVETKCSGFSADVVESQITKILEDQFSGINGIKYIVSVSERDRSMVKIFLEEGMDLNIAFSDVLALISRCREKLPNEIAVPIVTKGDTDATPIMTLCISGDGYSLAYLNDYTERNLENYFSAIQGVAIVQTYGGSSPEMHLLLDPNKLLARSLTIDDITEALYANNINTVAIGRFKSSEMEMIAKFTRDLNTEEDFDNLIISRAVGGIIVRLSDVGKAVSTSDCASVDVRYNDKPAVLMTIVAQPAANPVDISRLARKKLEQIKDVLPVGMKIEISDDKSTFINNAINEVYYSIFEAILLVVLVIFLFLRSFRAALIPIVTIPICLISTFAIMNIFGFTINILTLLAMVLAVGLLVDDAIIVVENVYRYLEKGEKPFDAAVKGFSEITFSIIAMTLTLAAVYLPVIMISGTTGQLFKEFALTLAGCILVSGFVALTLSPMMCARVLKNAEGDISHVKFVGFFNMISRYEQKLRIFYDRTLNYAFSHVRNISFIVVIFVSVACIALYSLPKEFIKKEDAGIVKVRGLASVVDTLTRMDKYMVMAENIAKTIPEVESILSVKQLNEENYLTLVLKPMRKWFWSAGRSRSNDEIATELNEKFATIPVGVEFRAYCPGDELSSSGPNDQSLSFYVQGNGKYSDVILSAQASLFASNQNKNIVRTDWNLAAMAQEYEVIVDADQAAAYGVTNIRSLANTVSIMIRGKQVTTFEKDGLSRYPVRVILDAEHRQFPAQLLSLTTKGRQEGKEFMVPLRDFISIREVSFYPEIRHFNGMRAITIQGELKKNSSPVAVYKEIKTVLQDKLPSGFYVTPSGTLAKIIEESNAILLVLMLALLFIFLIMAAQFESFVSPLIVMFSVPLALCGALITLRIVPSGSLNLFSSIGMITLIGLITKHGILIVDFADNLVSEGTELVDAIKEACRIRFRPVLMTTLAMVLGSLPLALASGPGSAARSQLGWVIVGGMSIGTIFTLVVLPLIYCYIKPWSTQYKRNKKS